MLRTNRDQRQSVSLAVLLLLLLGQLSFASHRGRSIEYQLCWGEGRIVTSEGWQVTLCDPIRHVGLHSSEASCKLLNSASLI